jgi:hypothetical protein
MRKLLFAAATAILFAAAGLVPTPAPAASRGADIGPLGQCFDPPDCGGRQSHATACSTVRERVVLPSGRVVHRSRQVCK